MKIWRIVVGDVYEHLKCPRCDGTVYSIVKLPRDGHIYFRCVQCKYHEPVELKEDNY